MKFCSAYCLIRKSTLEHIALSHPPIHSTIQIYYLSSKRADKMKPSYLFVPLSHLVDREVILGHLNRNQYNKSYYYSNKFKVNHISWFSHSSKLFQIVSLCILLNKYDKSLMNQSMAKQAKWPVHPVKTQISLGICPVRSWACVQSDPSLQYSSWVVKTPSSCRQQRLWSDWVDA